MDEYTEVDDLLGDDDLEDDLQRDEELLQELDEVTDLRKEQRLNDLDLNDFTLRDISDSDESDEEKQREAEEEENRRRRETAAASHKQRINQLLELPPGIDLFGLRNNLNRAFKYFNFQNLSLVNDFNYKRVEKLRAHGFSEDTIAKLLSDRLTFVRYLMPEAQSVLLCDAADFKAIMDYLFFSISVCTDRRLRDLLTKAFFDLRKNYGFKWKLKIGHVVAVLLNYGASEKAILLDKFYSKMLSSHRAAVEETGQSISVNTYGIEKKLPTFFGRRRKLHTAGEQLAPDQLVSCVAHFVVLLSEFSAGLTSHLEMIYKKDFSDLAVFLYMVLLVGTDKHFVANFRVMEAISSMLHYSLEHVPAVLWYRGPAPSRHGGPMKHPDQHFVRTLAKLVQEFFPGEICREVMTWTVNGRRDDEAADHPLNMLHRLQLIPPSFRGNQLKKQLAFLCLQTRLQLKKIVEPNPASILEVVNTPLLRNCAKDTYMKLIMHKSSVDYGALLVILKLFDMIVGYEPELDFTEEKVKAISIMEKEFLEVLRNKLPSIGLVGKDEQNLILGTKCISYLDLVWSRWTSETKKLPS